MKKYVINSFMFENGERFCHVVEKISGEPIYHPNLYLLTQIRNRSSSINTIQLIAGSLVLLHNWFYNNHIDIEERIRKLDFLEFNELDSLSDYMSMNYKRRKGSPENKPSLAKGPTKYFRLSVICDYMEWLCNLYLTLSGGKDIGSKIKPFIRELKNKRPLNTDRYKKEIPDKTLNRKQLDILFHIINPGSELNPFSQKVQVRNRLMMLMLYSFGIRVGELLNLRVSDIDFLNSTIVIKRRADDKSDPRVKQPLVKTSERKMPVGKELMEEIYSYITKDRSKINKSRLNEFIFITYQSGDTNGMPLSISAYHKIINVISKSHSDLSGLCGHQLRHTWNYEFSVMVDSLSDGISQEKEEQIRCYLMGWCIGSETAKIYNRRHLVEEAHKTSLTIQKELMEGILYE